MGSQLSTRFNNENRISHSATHKREYITESLIFKILNRKKEINFHGDHETHVSDGSEGELNTLNAVCEKNPGHTEFIPVYTFTLEHLPKGQRDNILYEYIKAVADLTVKVNVKMASPHRPEFWPKTNNPYPFYNMREQEGLRTGSGMVSLVYKYTDGVNTYGNQHSNNFTKCWCRKCEHSDSPSNVWWEFIVYTATHVVFDDIEASHTTLRLFYDSKDGPVIIVNKVSVDHVKIEYDICWLKCVTCDTNLGDKLEKIEKHYEDVLSKVQDKYYNSRSVDKLTFIVSHPHGCTKQVSVGHWMNEYKVGKYERKFTYTTCTCPGSSGAQVHCVGYRDWWLSYPGPVHCGTNYEHKYNYSGVC